MSPKLRLPAISGGPNATCASSKNPVWPRPVAKAPQVGRGEEALGVRGIDSDRSLSLVIGPLAHVVGGGGSDGLQGAIDRHEVHLVRDRHHDWERAKPGIGVVAEGVERRAGNAI